eukprot:TRINITY_DN6935_c0_g1_i2.p2 TRINITY_DN6935_c0_g1~~TRINITY_DN6935_c0_g1_i2.p2  ORF type:complete len:107 (-),score=10.04 TRINITY_DN6935_c0_g1_i2:85-405(-)
MLCLIIPPFLFCFWQPNLCFFLYWSVFVFNRQFGAWLVGVVFGHRCPSRASCVWNIECVNTFFVLSLCVFFSLIFGFGEDVFFSFFFVFCFLAVWEKRSFAERFVC